MGGGGRTMFEAGNSRTFQTVLIFLIVALLCSLAYSKIIYVDDDAAGANDGKSWENAYVYLQDALADANSAEKPIEIRVAQGIYKPDQGADQTAGDRDATFQFINSVSLKGGYAGLGEVDPNARDFDLYLTILSGDLNDNDVNMDFTLSDIKELLQESSRLDNSYHIIFAVQCDYSASIEGFMITAGNANGRYDDIHGRGAGLYISDSSPQVMRCKFIGNSATRGGVVYNDSWKGHLVLSECIFKRNGSEDGGAIYNRWGDILLTNCIFANNNTRDTGGAICNFASYTCFNCIFNNNRSGFGGGIYNRGRSTLTNCVFTNNNADHTGGVLSSAAGTTLNNCILWSNSDVSGIGESSQIQSNLGGSSYLNHCCVQGWTGNIEGTAVTGQYPMFVDFDGQDNLPGTDDDDFRLLAVSPCVDAGDNNAVTESILTDIEGNPRIVGGSVDIGAYEGYNQGIVVTNTNIDVPESSQSSFSVLLAKDPCETVEIEVVVVESKPEVAIISGAKLVFDSSNFLIPQHVTLSAGQDSDYIPGQVLIELSGTGFITININVTVSDPQSPAVLYVDDSATGTDDGTNWQNAFVSLQDALFIARLVPTLCEIRVAQGIYKPDHGMNQNLGDREATFQLINDIALKGGYAGFGQTNPDARDFELYKTILNGDLADNDVPIDDPLFLSENSDFLYDDPNRTDNSLCVVTATVAVTNTSLEGFVVLGAYDYYPGEYDYISAGLYISGDPNITIRNCEFTKNAASGIFGSGVSNSTIEDCIFRNNTAPLRMGGGGICIDYGSASIIRCTFEDNWAWNGGGLYFNGGQYLVGGLLRDDSLYLEDCTFTHNVASGLYWADVGYGGGICNPTGTDYQIKNCLFVDNIASTGGGILFGYPGSALLPLNRDEKTLMTGCTFIHNRARQGGAINQGISTLDIEHCMFLENSALSRGGAISTSLNITNLDHCIFSGNSAFDSGASIYAVGSEVSNVWGDPLLLEFILTLNNCTFRGNSAPIGRTLHCRSHDSEDMDTTIISNCIIDNDGSEIHNPDGSQIIINYTDLLGGASSIHDPSNAVVWGEGNIDVNPDFVLAGYWTQPSPRQPTERTWIEGNYHLKSEAGRWDPNSQSWVVDYVTSPCIDAGDPNSPIGDEPDPNGGRINMGAYGGTEEASKSPGYSWWLETTQGLIRAFGFKSGE